MAIQNGFYLIIKDVEKLYVNFRRSGKSRDDALKVIRDDYVQELQDADDRLPVLIGLSLALCKKKELIEPIATETLNEITCVIRECELNKKDLEYLLNIEQSLKDKKVYGQEALYKQKSVYVPDWKIGDTFSHILTCPLSENLGIKGWLILLCKVGEFIDEFGVHRQLMCASLCPPEKVPACKEDFQELGFLRMMRMGDKTEYIAQMTLKSKRAEKACGLTKIGCFPDISFPDDCVVLDLLTAMPLFGMVRRGESWPGYEVQVCVLYKTNGMKR
ncbi:MAG: hypothetical protein IJZ85_00525 [Lachnospiraceae bacterium]|nr:hypothetical protein [Lachnospiraceae bacterium]